MLRDAERANVLAREFGEPPHTEKQSAHERGGMAYASQPLKLYRRQDILKMAGFPNAAALRQAVHRKKIGFPVFLVPGRRGRFAWTLDVAKWLEGLAKQQARSKAEAGRCDMT